jgi:uncharacterized protein (TIGR04255 family)
MGSRVVPLRASLSALTGQPSGLSLMAPHMPQTTPRFRNPPVVETVLGVQFATLPGWTFGHPGWFWKGYLPPEWENAADAPPLIDQFEGFGEERKWVQPSAVQLQVFAAPLTRLQITNAAGDRMIQVQPTRFHYNWQKRDVVYPSYRTMKAEFDSLFTAFRKFAADAKLGAVSPNQWELTYVDQIPRGTLWDSPADWHKILPGLFPSVGALGGYALESVVGEWHYVIEPARGRIHVALQSGRTSATGIDVLNVQTTARGPIRQEPGWGLDEGLELGHDAVLAAFLEMTSSDAHEAWGIEKG